MLQNIILQINAYYFNFYEKILEKRNVSLFPQNH